MLRPSDVIIQRDNGTGIMGSLAYLTDSDTNNSARFGLDVPYVLVALRGHFSGAAGQADATINLDSGWGPKYDTALWILDGPSGTGVGVGKDIRFRVQLDELQHWKFDGGAGDEIVITWTNPDIDNITWGLEALLAPETAVR